MGKFSLTPELMIWNENFCSLSPDLLGIMVDNNVPEAGVGAQPPVIRVGKV